MSEQRFDKLEEMIASLIAITGNLNKSVQELKVEQQSMKEEIHGLKVEQQLMKKEIQGLKVEQQSMKEEMKAFKEELTIFGKEQQSMRKDIQELKEGQQSIKTELLEFRTENLKSHQVILRQLNKIEADQDYTWEKAALNEREIDRIKKQLEV
ncbi:hypothetical protein [Niallia sp. 01092]|uniref:hypothetical protein n=1 Tax=unclassified Niallia TaxID=2837522 RepID=UPI003FD1175E